MWMNVPILLVVSATDAPTTSQPPTTVPAPQVAPFAAYPPPPPDGLYRGTSLSFSLGPGWLALRDQLGRDGQRATGLAARLGTMITPNWVVYLGGEHTTTSRGNETFSQTGLMVGVQPFLLDRIYLLGAVGFGWVRASGAPDNVVDGPGPGFSIGGGAELVRGHHFALNGEVTFTMASYGREKWEMGGIRVGLSIF